MIRPNEKTPLPFTLLVKGPVADVKTITDPMERMIAGALDRAGVEYRHEVNGLDFYLPGRNVYIEVKQMHSPRIADQMSRAPNVIAVQGVEAVTMLCALIDAY